jgi:metal-sulfur cluster biosynthetic enzyme
MRILLPGCKHRRNSEEHICIELADMQHIVDVRIYTNMVYLSVLHDVSCRQVQHLSMTVDKRKCAAWEDIIEAYIEKAMKAFPKPVRHRNVTEDQIRRGW